jgi:hypothetical protein
MSAGSVISEITDPILGKCLEIDVPSGERIIVRLTAVLAYVGLQLP